mmetsp:Transcript_39326/g.76991  ORF Transcript_39326/g.76991 Transcript_39326/m.76991 type:complete len:227 (+) Transcript_39326:1882-2562(+)
MQSVAPPPSLEHAARELVHNQDLIALLDILDLLLEQALGLEGVDDVGRPGVTRVEEIVHIQDFLHVGKPSLCQHHALRPLVHGVVHLLLENRRDLGAVGVLCDGRHRLLRDDQRRTGLVNHDAVSLVHNAHVQGPSEDHVLRHHGQVVAQEVEAKLRVGHVRDIHSVVCLALIRLHVGLNQTHTQPKEAMDLSDVLRIAPCKVVVDSDDMHALALEGVEVGRERGH